MKSSFLFVILIASSFLNLQSSSGSGDISPFYVAAANQLWHIQATEPPQLVFTLPAQTLEQALEEFPPGEHEFIAPFITPLFDPYEGRGSFLYSSIRRVQRLDESRFLLLVDHRIYSAYVSSSFGYYEVLLADIDHSSQSTRLFKIGIHDEEILQRWGCPAPSGSLDLNLRQFLVNPIHDAVVLTFSLDAERHGERRCDPDKAAHTLFVIDFSTYPVQIHSLEAEGAGWSADGDHLSYLLRRCSIGQDDVRRCRFLLRVGDLETFPTSDVFRFILLTDEDTQQRRPLTTGWTNNGMLVVQSYEPDYAAGEPRATLTWISFEEHYRVTIQQGTVYPFHPWQYFITDGSLFVREIASNDSVELQSRWEAFQQAQMQAPVVTYNPRFPEYLFLSAVQMNNSMIAVDDSLNQYTLDVTGTLPNGEVVQLITP
jgi:hypothetical protein